MTEPTVATTHLISPDHADTLSSITLSSAYDRQSSAYDTQSSDFDTATDNDTDDSLYLSSSSPSPELRSSYHSSPYHDKQSYYQANDLKIPMSSDTLLYSECSPNAKRDIPQHSHSFGSRGTPRMSTPLLERCTSNQSNSSFQLVSEPLNDQQSTELVRFMVTVDTDLQTFVLRCLSVLIASLVVFSLSGDLSPWHAVMTAPTLVFGLIVFFHASSDEAIIKNLFYACCMLVFVQAMNCLVCVLMFDSAFNDHLWDLALLIVLMIISCSLFDLYRTKERLTARYINQYYDDVKRTTNALPGRRLSIPNHESSSDDEEIGTSTRARSLSQERVNQSHALADAQLQPLSILHSIALLSHENSHRPAVPRSTIDS